MKKNYQAPKLTILGSAAELTETYGMFGGFSFGKRPGFGHMPHHGGPGKSYDCDSMS